MIVFSLTSSFFKKFAFPRAKKIISAFLHFSFKLTVLEWEIVTVAFLFKSIKDNGYNISQEIEITLSNENETFKNIVEVKIDKTNLEQTKKVNIKETSLAFDHVLLIYYAIERLKNKLEYTDIIFNLLPKTFTLTELKNSYEVILNEKLLDANFRRKTSKMVLETKDFVTGKGHRSSRLFTINPTYNIINLD